jgi:hypothetical protein
MPAILGKESILIRELTEMTRKFSSYLFLPGIGYPEKDARRKNNYLEKGNGLTSHSSILYNLSYFDYTHKKRNRAFVNSLKRNVDIGGMEPAKHPLFAEISLLLRLNQNPVCWGDRVALMY